MVGVKRHGGLLRTVLYCVVWVVVFFALQALAAIPFVKPGMEAKDIMLPITLVSSTVFVLVVALSFVVRKENPLKELGCTRVGFVAGALPFLGALLLSLGYNVALGTWVSGNASRAQSESLYTYGIGYAVLMIVVIQPIAEEVLLRGLIMRRLARHMPGWVALCFSAGVFGVFHLLVDVSLGPVTLVFGLVFAYAFYRSRSLVPAVLAHMGANIGGMVVDFWDYSGIHPHVIVGVCFVVGAVALVGFARGASVFTRKE